ncbi:MAG: hypothetical protein ACHRXM_33300 [Isosphaerales bacterium]
MSNKLIHQDLSEAIIGAAMTVLNALEPGFVETNRPLKVFF